MAKLGRPKAFSGPQELWDWYEKYKTDILENPIKLEKYVGKDAKRVETTHYKPPTWAGFEAFLFRNQMIYDLDDYKRNVRKAYTDFQGVIHAIGREMFDKKFAGASVGEYQHNIIAMELGLAAKAEITQTFNRPILEGGQELPPDEDDEEIGLSEEDPLF